MSMTKQDLYEIVTNNGYTTDGVKFEIVKFNPTEVTLLDSSGEYSYAHPLYPMKPWIAEENNAPQT